MISKLIKSIFSSNKKDKDMATKTNKTSVGSKDTLKSEKQKIVVPKKATTKKVTPPNPTPKKENKKPIVKNTPTKGTQANSVSVKSVSKKAKVAVMPISKDSKTKAITTKPQTGIATQQVLKTPTRTTVKSVAKKTENINKAVKDLKPIVKNTPTETKSIVKTATTKKNKAKPVVKKEIINKKLSKQEIAKVPIKLLTKQNKLSKTDDKLKINEKVSKEKNSKQNMTKQTTSKPAIEKETKAVKQKETQEGTTKSQVPTVNLAPGVKRKVIVDYKNVPEEVLMALSEKYPHGYNRGVIKFTNAKNEVVSAVPIELGDTSYLVKVSTQLQKMVDNIDIDDDDFGAVGLEKEVPVGAVADMEEFDKSDDDDKPKKTKAKGKVGSADDLEYGFDYDDDKDDDRDDDDRDDDDDDDDEKYDDDDDDDED